MATVQAPVMATTSRAAELRAAASKLELRKLTWVHLAGAVAVVGVLTAKFGFGVAFGVSIAVMWAFFVKSLMVLCLVAMYYLTKAIEEATETLSLASFRLGNDDNDGKARGLDAGGDGGNSSSDDDEGRSLVDVRAMLDTSSQRIDSASKDAVVKLQKAVRILDKAIRIQTKVDNVQDTMEAAVTKPLNAIGSLFGFRKKEEAAAQGAPVPEQPPAQVPEQARVLPAEVVAQPTSLPEQVGEQAQLVGGAQQQLEEVKRELEPEPQAEQGAPLRQSPQAPPTPREDPL